MMAKYQIPTTAATLRALAIMRLPNNILLSRQPYCPQGRYPAAGKGVTQTQEEAQEALKAMMQEAKLRTQVAPSLLKNS